MVIMNHEMNNGNGHKTGDTRERAGLCFEKCEKRTPRSRRAPPKGKARGSRQTRSRRLFRP